MIRAVLFDIGGVLTRTEDLGPRRKWEKQFGFVDWDLANLVFGNPAARRASLGQASLEEVWAEVARQLSLSPTELEALKLDFWKGDVWDKSLLGYINTLRPRFKTGIISNAFPGAREAVQNYVNSDLFDALLFSYEEGVEKPDPEIYRRALTRLDVGPAEAVFVDDLLRNVEGAQAVGMQGVHFTDPVKARDEINRIIHRGLIE